MAEKKKTPIIKRAAKKIAQDNENGARRNLIEELFYEFFQRAVLWLW